MVNVEQPFGIAWKTTAHNKATSVWFAAKTSRASHYADLKRNPIVIKSSITFYYKDERGVIKKEKY